jgi:hypothetical protein
VLASGDRAMRTSAFRFGTPNGGFYSLCTHLTRLSFAFRNASDPFFAVSSLHRRAYCRGVVGKIGIRRVFGYGRIFGNDCP